MKIFLFAILVLASDPQHPQQMEPMEMPNLETCLAQVQALMSDESVVAHSKVDEGGYIQAGCVKVYPQAPKA